MTQLKVAILGCGNIASNIDSDLNKRHIYTHAKALSLLPYFEIVSCCDIDELTLERFSSKWRINKTYTDFQKMINVLKII